MKIGVLSTSRADYSIYLPLLRKIQADPSSQLNVYALGMHTSPMFGSTHRLIEEDGFKVLVGEDSLAAGDGPIDIATNMGRTAMAMVGLLRRELSDLYVCLGDRYEMFAAASVLVPLGAPLIHIAGGEITVGAIDEKFRHGLTKLADVHFVTCEEHRQRVMQMGVPGRLVHNVGSLAVEHLQTVPLLTLDEILEKYEVDLRRPTVLVTFQPITAASAEQNRQYIEEFCLAMDHLDYQFVITLGNADTCGMYFRERFQDLARKRPEKYKVFNSLGPVGYPNFLRHCAIMLGNSSSGIVEAASFNMAVVNVGERQKGRPTSKNVISTGYSSVEILDGFAAAERMVGQEFINIYEKPHVSERVLEILKQIPKKQNFEFSDLRFEDPEAFC